MSDAAWPRTVAVVGAGTMGAGIAHVFAAHGVPSLRTTSAAMPGSGRVAEPGFVGVAPGSGEIMIAPVSVCHHVSTIGQRPPPTFSRYQIQASGLIGSPTEPSNRSEVRSCGSSSSAPHFM